MAGYHTTIGLEIHAQLKTKTKMFSRSLNDPDETRPNINVSPVDLAHPGTLPTINKEAVKSVLKVGIALNGELADYTEFDRKNYFYPDIPKGYQISQYKYPLVSGGELNGVRITRVHLEEDTGRSLHDQGDFSIVDYNRAGIPLMELVTEPDMHSTQEAGDFARELQLLFRTLEVSEANMEKGEMRVEVNLSISPDKKKLGTKVEVKNINSFRAAERAIEYEVKRQSKLLDSGKEVVQETRGWDEKKQITFSQRSKEDAHDYRYFPDPDLPKLKISEISEFNEKALRSEIPELPWDKRARLEKEFGVKEEDIAMYVANEEMFKLFELAMGELSESSPKANQILSNFLTSDLIGLQKDSGKDGFGKLMPKSLAAITDMFIKGNVSSRGAKDLLAIIYKNGGDVRTIAEEKNILQMSDPSVLEDLVKEILTKNPIVVKEYKGGKESALQFFLGQAMKRTKGNANPKVLQELFREKLDN